MKTFKRDLLGVVNKKGQFSCIGLTDENSMIGYNHLRNVNKALYEEDDFNMRDWKKIPKLLDQVVRAVNVRLANPTNTQTILSALDCQQQEENPDYQGLNKDIYSLQREGMFIWPKDIVSAPGLVAKNLDTILRRVTKNPNSEAVVFNEVEPAKDHFKLNICGWYNTELDADSNRKHSFFVLSPKKSTKEDNIKFYLNQGYDGDVISYKIGDQNCRTLTNYRPRGKQIEITWFHSVWDGKRFCCSTKNVAFDVLWS